MAAKWFQTRTEEIEQLLHNKSSKSTNKVSDNALRTFQRSVNICDLIHSYDLWLILNANYWDL